MVLGIADDRHAPAVGTDDISLGHGFDCVVRALAVHVRTKREQQSTNVVLVKNDHGVDASHRCDKQGAIRLRKHRPIDAFQTPHRIVSIYAHDEQIRLGARALEVSYVPHMKDVEASVGESHSKSFGSRPLDERARIIQRADLGSRRPYHASLPALAQAGPVRRQESPDTVETATHTGARHASTRAPVP